jgi:hypothetical protein
MDFRKDVDINIPSFQISGIPFLPMESEENFGIKS